jgi:metal-responsive CopG/Arc/MetJ family transcriptional regulator
MAKILVDIPSEFMAQLDSIAQKEQLPRDVLICIAVKAWLSQQAQTIPINAFGLLKNKFIEDSVQWQKKIRAEWI